MAETFTFKPTPNKPNCVSTMADPSDTVHYIEPLPYTIEKAEAIELLLDVLGKEPKVRIKIRTTSYIHAEFKTAFFSFIDDVEFYFPDTEKLIHIRSASRIGYYDFGTNRKRIEHLKEKMIEALAAICAG
jgi:uncharacterized protein (DUF1499 family)